MSRSLHTLLPDASNCDDAVSEVRVGGIANANSSQPSVCEFLIGPDHPLTIIAGPCVLETLAGTFEIAESLIAAAARVGFQLIFKASFDKANRTSLSSFRGPGIDEGLGILAEVRSKFAIPVTTDVHLPEQAAVIGQVCDILQIPAFLARQTDLLLAAAKTGKPVNVKKGQFMAPNDMKYVVEKLRGGGAGGVVLCERGTFFGYGRLVNDMTGLVEMRRLGTPGVFDATHSVQQPGGLSGATGGNRAMVPPLARAAVAVGVDGVFLETHPNPDQSPSDGPNMVPLAAIPQLFDQLARIRSAVTTVKS